MARPSKYNWEAIKEAYEGGIDKQDIIKKYKIDNKQLLNKIYNEKWEVKGHLKAEIDGFYDNVHKTTQNIEKLHPDNQDILLERLNTLEQDNELVSNNRKIAKMLQGIIVSNRNLINLQNIKSVSGVIRDIEAIANPTNKTETVINNANMQETNIPMQINIVRDN